MCLCLELNVEVEAKLGVGTKAGVSVEGGGDGELRVDGGGAAELGLVGPVEATGGEIDLGLDGSGAISEGAAPSKAVFEVLSGAVDDLGGDGDLGEVVEEAGSALKLVLAVGKDRDVVIGLLKLSGDSPLGQTGSDLEDGASSSEELLVGVASLNLSGEDGLLLEISLDVAARFNVQE